MNLKSQISFILRIGWSNSSNKPIIHTKKIGKHKLQCNTLIDGRATNKMNLKSYQHQLTLSVPKYMSFCEKKIVPQYMSFYITNKAFNALFPLIPLINYFSFFFQFYNLSFTYH
jgi:hypothetical protein